MKKSLLYLNTPSLTKIDPPIDTKKGELPIEKLAWEDFEKLCLRVVQENYSIDDCEIYGIKGQGQEKIDIFAKKENSKYATYQCKRYQTVNENTLEKAIKDFKEGSWFAKSDEFVFCTSASLNKTQLQDKFNSLKTELKKSKVKLIKWDKKQLCRKLKKHPQIVFDFFGKEWVRKFNGEEFLNIITKKRKLDANDVAKFRKELFSVYSTAFQQYDPGIPAQELQENPYLIQDRFISPDVFKEINSQNFFPLNDNQHSEINEDEKELISRDIPENRYRRNRFNSHEEEFKIIKRKDRLNFDSILPQNKRTIILGDPGSGKSTLLRYIVLDLLRDNPKLVNISHKWCESLPIWLPFAYITKNLSKDENLNLSELLKLWFKSINKEPLFEIVEEALNDERLLLIIDGIDEWTSTSAAEYAISKIEIQSKLSNSNIIYSSRPYGYRLLKNSFPNIHELELAPFSREQQKQFIFNWYERWRIFIRSADEQFAENETNHFIEELDKSTDLRFLSENPLLLSILITQKFKDSVLPKNKLKALKAITDHLINIHPRKRKISASISNEEESNELSDIFSELAIYIQKNNHEGIILKSDAQKVIEDYLTKFNGYEPGKAKKKAEKLLDIGANNIGIIIEKSNDEIAFMHRQFQEFMAAKYLLDSDKSDTIKILKENTDNPTWHQVITYFFGLISNRKEQEFKEFLSIIDNSIKTNGMICYSSFLKYEILLNSNNAPVNLAKESLKEIIPKFEYETNKNIKSNLWRIILNSLQNLKIRDDVLKFLFNYYPNYYKFTDYRLIALQDIPLDCLIQTQKELIVKSLINGNIDQKLDASNTIRLFIKDNWVEEKVFELLDDCLNPEIVSFALNCIITDEVSPDIKKLYFEKFKSTEHPQIALFATKLKVHLHTHNEKDLIQFIKLQKNVHYTLEDEVINIFINGWSGNEKLFNECLNSIKKPSVHKSLLNHKIAWEVLLRGFNQNEKVVDRIIYELNNENIPFIGLTAYKVWSIISNSFRDNKKLIPEVDKWLKKQYRTAPIIAYASLISRTDETKKYLLDILPKSDYSHWITMALLEGWKNDLKVIEFLQGYFKSDYKNKYFSSHFIGIVFQDKKNEGIKILEEMIFNRELPHRDRAIEGLIKLDSEYFKNHVLENFINNEIESLYKKSKDQYTEALYSIIKNYKNLKIVKEYVLLNLSDKVRKAEILIRFYPNEIKTLKNVITISQPLPIEYRLQLLEKIDEYKKTDSNIIKQLSLYAKESEDILKSTAAISYFNHLKNFDQKKIISICKNKVFYCGFDHVIQRQIVFCGYLLIHKLPAFFTLKDERTLGIANPSFDFEHSYKEMSSNMIKVLINNFEYLISEAGEDFHKLMLFDNPDPQKTWGFWAKHSDSLSPSFSHINKFINSNEKIIDNGDLISFLNRTAPKSTILKNIALRIIEKENSPNSALAGEILGENFNNNDKIYEIVSNVSDISVSGGKIVAMCVGWPDSTTLEDIYKKVRDTNCQVENYAAYHLKFLFCPTNDIMEFLNKVFLNYNEAKYHHALFIQPIMKRIEKDKKLQKLIHKKLLITTSASAQISFYSILNSINKIDDEVITWKEKIINNLKNDAYGYNIMTNELVTVSEVLNTETI